MTVNSSEVRIRRSIEVAGAPAAYLDTRIIAMLLVQLSSVRRDLRIEDLSGPLPSRARRTIPATSAKMVGVRDLVNEIKLAATHSSAHLVSDVEAAVRCIPGVKRIENQLLVASKAAAS